MVGRQVRRLAGGERSVPWWQWFRSRRVVLAAGVGAVLLAAAAYLGAGRSLVTLAAAFGALHLLAVALLGVLTAVGTGIGTRGRAIRWAGRYDAVVAVLALGRARALRERTVELARIGPGDAVLDVGCGTGDLTLRAKARSGPFGRVTGVDPASEMIAVARRKADGAGCAIDYRVAGVEALPFPDASFDAALSSLMMHHLPDDLKRRGLAEIRRVLKPGGRLVVVDLARSATRWGRLALPLLFHRRMASGVQDLSRLLEDAGFTAIETGETGLRAVGFARARAVSQP